jgi:hypothetical protein
MLRSRAYARRLLAQFRIDHRLPPAGPGWAGGRRHLPPAGRQLALHHAYHRTNGRRLPLRRARLAG